MYVNFPSLKIEPLFCRKNVSDVTDLHASGSLSS